MDNHKKCSVDPCLMVKACNTKMNHFVHFKPKPKPQQCVKSCTTGCIKVDCHSTLSKMESKKTEILVKMPVSEVQTADRLTISGLWMCIVGSFHLTDKKESMFS